MVRTLDVTSRAASRLINTLLQRGVVAKERALNRFNGFPPDGRKSVILCDRPLKTVKTVHRGPIYA
jgi:hypothetical protein